ncbi:MAG: hypothetical protein OCC49_07840 [Fibrobacterales bacterium]
MIVRLLWVLLLALALVSAETFTVEGTGWGVSENEATMQAKRDALAIGIGQLLLSKTEVENFMVKRDQIISQTMGHVKRYEVLSKKRAADGSFEVTIRADVSKEGISADLAALLLLKEAIGNPRIAMLIEEKTIGPAGESVSLTETLLIEFFKSRGFEVVDPSYALTFRESEKGAQAMAGNSEMAAELGAQLNADVIIVGKVVAMESDVSNIKAFTHSSMKSASANVSLKAIHVQSRQIAAAKKVDAPAIHVNTHTAGNRAIEKAVAKLLDSKGKNTESFFDALVESWRASANDGALFRVTVLGVSSYTLSKKVTEALSSSIGESYTARSYTKPSLKGDLTFIGNSSDLCDKLEGLRVSKMRVLSVEKCAHSEIDLNLIKK